MTKAVGNRKKEKSPFVFTLSTIYFFDPSSLLADFTLLQKILYSELQQFHLVDATTIRFQTDNTEIFIEHPSLSYVYKRLAININTVLIPHEKPTFQFDQLKVGDIEPTSGGFIQRFHYLFAKARIVPKPELLDVIKSIDFKQPFEFEKSFFHFLTNLNYC